MARIAPAPALRSPGGQVLQAASSCFHPRHLSAKPPDPANGSMTRCSRPADALPGREGANRAGHVHRLKTAGGSAWPGSPHTRLTNRRTPSMGQPILRGIRAYETSSSCGYFSYVSCCYLCGTGIYPWPQKTWKKRAAFACCRQGAGSLRFFLVVGFPASVRGHARPFLLWFFREYERWRGRSSGGFSKEYRYKVSGRSSVAGQLGRHRHAAAPGHASDAGNCRPRGPSAGTLKHSHPHCQYEKS